MEDKIRLAKRIAESGIASRREAERLIKEGRVKVDGSVVNTPVCFVSENNVISVDEKLISKKSEKTKIWKFYKPVGVVTSRRDSKGRPTVFDYFKDFEKDRLLYIGRLDCNSEGLLLFTNNGNLSREMELPKTALKRTYRVRIFGKLPGDAKEKLERGIVIGGIKYGPVKISEENAQATSRNRWINVTLFEGKNREIRKLMEHFGCSVNRLIRTSYGPFTLNKLRHGEIKEVTEEDVIKLVKSLKNH